MKSLRSILAAGLALAVFGTAARAVTFQVAADTAGSPVTKKIAKAAGAATTLPVTKTSTAYFSFDVGNSGINPNAVTAARLVIFFPRVTKGGNLTLFANNSAFTEVFATATIPTPTAGATIGSPFPVTTADSKNFLTIDVTSQVVSWLTNPSSDFGFGISGDATANLLIGSKEGPGSGYPAVLEVDVNDQAGGAVAGSSAIFSGSVSIGENPFLDQIQLLSTGSALFGNYDNAALGVDSGQVGARLGFLKKSGAGPVIASALGNPIIFSQSDQNSIFDNIAASTVTERMRIDSNGNVGIGTSTPKHTLDVKGNLFMGTAQSGADFTQLADTLYIASPRKYLSTTLGAKVNNNTDWLNLMCHPLSGGILFGTSGPSDADPHSAPNPLMVIQSGGNVGIGTTTPSKKLEVNGGIKCIGAVDISSDGRYKMNIQPLAGALAQTLRLRGVSYDWNRAKFPDKGFDDRHQLGFIAQEVRAILPDVVSEDQDGYLSIGYTALIPVLAEAVKELKQQKDAEIAALKADNEALAQKLTALEARDADREARLTKLESALADRPARPVSVQFEFK